MGFVSFAPSTDPVRWTNLSKWLEEVNIKWAFVTRKDVQLRTSCLSLADRVPLGVRQKAIVLTSRKPTVQLVLKTF